MDFLLLRYSDPQILVALTLLNTNFSFLHSGKLLNAGCLLPTVQSTSSPKAEIKALCRVQSSASFFSGISILHCLWYDDWKLLLPIIYPTFWLFIGEGKDGSSKRNSNGIKPLLGVSSIKKEGSCHRLEVDTTPRHTWSQTSLFPGYFPYTYQVYMSINCFIN